MRHFPATRLLTMLEILLQRGKVSGKELAERLEVDERTVRRYITALQRLYPIESVGGRYGGYRICPGSRVPLIFQDDEAFALTIGLIAARHLGLTTNIPAVTGAQTKIERVLSAMLQEQVRAVQETLTFDYRLVEPVPKGEIVVMLCVAAQQKRRVWLRYQAAMTSETMEREFDPYGVVCRSGYWYTVGYCHLRQEIRTFRLDRIRSSRVLARTFEPPDNFDCVAYVNRSLAMMPIGHTVDVLLETTLEEARRMISPALATLEQEEGGVAMRCYAESLEWIARVLLMLRCPFIIREPAELRTTLREVAQEVMKMAERVP